MLLIMLPSILLFLDKSAALALELSDLVGAPATTSSSAVDLSSLRNLLAYPTGLEFALLWLPVQLVSAWQLRSNIDVWLDCIFHRTGQLCTSNLSRFAIALCFGAHSLCWFVGAGSILGVASVILSLRGFSVDQHLLYLCQYFHTACAVSAVAINAFTALWILFDGPRHQGRGFQHYAAAACVACTTIALVGVLTRLDYYINYALHPTSERVADWPIPDINILKGLKVFPLAMLRLTVPPMERRQLIAGVISALLCVPVLGLLNFASIELMFGRERLEAYYADPEAEIANLGISDYCILYTRAVCLLISFATITLVCAPPDDTAEKRMASFRVITSICTVVVLVWGLHAGLRCLCLRLRKEGRYSGA